MLHYEAYYNYLIGNTIKVKDRLHQGTMEPRFVIAIIPTPKGREQESPWQATTETETKGHCTIN